MIGSEVIQRLMVDKWDAFAKVPLGSYKETQYLDGTLQENDSSGHALYRGFRGWRTETHGTGSTLFRQEHVQYISNEHDKMERSRAASR